MLTIISSIFFANWKSFIHFLLSLSLLCRSTLSSPVQCLAKNEKCEKYFFKFFFKWNLPFVSVPLINLQMKKCSTLPLIGGGRTRSQALLWERHTEKPACYFKTLNEYLITSCVSGTVHLGVEAPRRCSD